MANLTVALATFNEEKNLGACLESIKDIASEIIIVDGSSTDKTVEIAKKYGARVHVTDNPPIFHINKQKALDMAKNTWVLQLDADEVVSPELAKEIEEVIEMNEEALENYQNSLPKKELFLRHQQLVEKRDGTIGADKGPYVAFFVPRRNYFLGKYLRYGGVYPDGVIRLVKKRHAHFPSKSVHEQIAVDGRVGWLANDLMHMADPTFQKYLRRNSRYIDLIAQEYRKENVKIGLANGVKYFFVLPTWWFTLTFFRHKGFLDGWPGFIFSVFSSLRFPKAYSKYKKSLKKI